MSQRNPDTNTSLEQLRNARDKPIQLAQSGNVPMAPRNMQLNSKMPTVSQNAIPARTFDVNVPGTRMPMPPSQSMPHPIVQNSNLNMQPKISEEQMRNALKAQETDRKQQTINLINNQNPKVIPQNVQRIMPQKNIPVQNNMPINNSIPKLPENVRLAMNNALDNQKTNEKELGLFDKIKKDSKLALIIFAVAFIISYPVVSKLIGKYIPGMLDSEQNITLIGQVILSAIIAILPMVAKHFVY